jgi:formate hydrogenlyase transcriptional activator
MVAEGLKSGCDLPLIGRRGVLGVLGALKRSESGFQREDVEFLEQVSRQVAIAVENALDYETAVTDRDAEKKQRRYLEEEIRAEFGEIVGESRALKTALSLVSVVAPTDSSVMILGETGTGKELVARAIHKLGRRSEKAFVKLNCAAIPLGLLESELFGHERGAFTGAVAQKTGRFELADKGTLFLDEVGDIPLELQAKLLRVLQEQEFERLGSNRTHKVDVRLIAATHRDLPAMVKQGTFREDLYYRLKVFPIQVPALRQRTDDIPRLVRHFTALYAQRMHKRIETVPSETMDALVRYQWPGNVRELQNFIERAVILSPQSVLRAPVSELDPLQADQKSITPLNGLAEVERDHILRALEASDWVIGGQGGAAARLGMKRTSLVYRMKKLRIDRPAMVPQKRSLDAASGHD